MKASAMRELEMSVDLPALRTRLEAMTDDELAAFGKQMHGLVYPLTYDYRGKPTVSAFSIQLDEARAEWRRRSVHGKHADVFRNRARGGCLDFDTRLEPSIRADSP